MNRNVVGAVLIIAALALIYFFAWPRLKPYITTPAPAPGGAETTGTMAI
ncbi:MAG: hypothetical protein ACR2IE_13245 [Candidatus Sumerlaeaceae bacterium]